MHETYSKPLRVCRQCGKKYLKDTGPPIPRWSISKYCSLKCQVGALKTRKEAKVKATVRRRKTMVDIGQSDKVLHLTELASNIPKTQEKIRQSKTSLSLEQRMQELNKLEGKPKNFMSNNQYSNVQRGEYDINGTTLYFRSKWEANYALYLDFLIDHKEFSKWEFEPDTFMFEAIKLGTRSYTPDFKVFKNDGSHEYHEVKGYMDSKSKTKLKRFAKYYPEEKLVLVDSAEYNLLKKQIGKICKFY